MTIQSRPPADPAAIPRLLADVREAGARALACGTDNIWASFEAAPRDWPHPPVVLVRATAGRAPAQRDAFAAAVAAAVGRGLSVPAESVWLHYQELRPQDVWYGGRWSG